LKKIKKDGIKAVFKDFRLMPFLGKLGVLAIVLLIIFPVWVGSYIAVGAVTKGQLNLIKEPIALSGTGSMYPTFPKGQSKTLEELAKETVGMPEMSKYPSGIVLLGKRLLGYTIGRGDIVSFSSSKTFEITSRDGGRPSGFAKRVVALPGDTVEIKDGLLIINGQPQKEPYAAKARSTFGGQFLAECKQITIPEGKLFVMGDNRKGSGDSRHELGLIDFNDINHVIPWKSQFGSLDKNWRDTSRDTGEASKIRLDKNKYLELLNEKRKEAGVKPLKYQPKLEQSAAKRGEIIIKFDDFSFEATRSGYTMEKAVRETGYSNITWGEAPTQGYYEADELIENQFQFPDSKKFLLDKNYQEVGIAEVEGEINGCPTQVIVQHFAGYIPPNYKKEDVESWKMSLNQLKEIQPAWARLKESPGFYERNKNDVDRINEILLLRISNMIAISKRMESNQWLTAAEQKMADQDKTLFDEQEAIAKRLNSASW
jgi:signal peptidase I